jgi:hypothetical protein
VHLPWDARRHATVLGTAVNLAVLTLASDPNGDALGVASVTEGSHGRVVINANGTVTYTPAAGFTGIDTFTYTVTDPYGHPAVGTGTVTVGPAVPVALAADAATATGAAVSVAVQSFVSDPGTLTTTAVTQGAHGGVVINGDGTVTYTPTAGFSGTDAFTYTVKNGGGQAATGTITVLVGGVAPAAADVQQTESVLALMTSELSNPSNVPTGLLPAQSAAVVAGITSYLRGFTVPINIVDARFAELSIQVDQYNKANRQYNLMLSIESALSTFLAVNGAIIDELNSQLLTALMAAQNGKGNPKLISLLAGQSILLSQIQLNVDTKMYGPLLEDLAIQYLELRANYKSLNNRLPVRLQLLISPPTPLPKSIILKE